MKRDGVRSIAAVLLGVSMIGCGGSGGPTGVPGSAGTPTGAAPTAGTGTTPEPGVSAAPTQPGSGSAAGVCDLATAEEIGQILGKPVALEVLEGPPDTCDVQSNGAPVAALVHQEGAASFAFDAFAADPSAEAVAGIGDRAIWFGTNGLFIVLKGDSTVSVSVHDVEIPDAEWRDLATQIGRIAAGRM